MASIDNIKDIYNFPSPFATDAQKRDKKFGLEYARALYQMYVQDNNLYSERINRYRIDRKYAEGMQSCEKYKDRMNLKEGDSSWLNLDFTPPPIIPKFLDIKIGQLTGQLYKIMCTPINADAKVDQDWMMDELYAKMFLKQTGALDIQKQTGVPMSAPGEYIPEDDDEAKLHFQMNFKSAFSMDLELAVDFVMYNNGWPEIERKLIRDLLVIKICAARSKFDINLDIVLDYLDPVKMVIPYSDNDNFNDMTHCGIVEECSIHDLAQMNAKLPTDQRFTENDLKNIAKQFANQYGNPQWNNDWNGTYYAMLELYGRRKYDNFKVKYLDFEFLTTSVKKWLFTEKKGRMFYDKKADTYETPEGSDNKEVVAERYKVRYEGKWIVGTEHIFDYKLSENMQFEQEDGIYAPQTSLSFKIIAPNIYEMVNQSMVERMIPFADQITLAHLKMQQITGSIKPIGIAVDISGLDEVMKGMGEGKFKPEDITKMYNQTGSFVYASQRSDGSIINGKPIEQLTNGVGNEVTTLITVYNHGIQQIRDVTGINEVADASSPDPKMPVGTSQMALSASSNVTKELQACYFGLIERIGKDVVMKIQDALEIGKEIKGFMKAIGNEAVSIIRLSKDSESGKHIMANQFGIKVELLSDGGDRQSLTNKINIALQSQEIRLEDAIFIEEIIKSNVKLAAQTLILRKKQYDKEKKEDQKQAIELNGKTQQESATKAIQEKAQAEMQVMEKQKELLAFKAQLEEKAEAQKHQNTMEEIALKNQGAVQVESTRHEGKVLHTAFDNATKNNAAPTTEV